MSQVEEIEKAIDSLPPEEFSRIAEWFRLREHQRWDLQMDEDSASGKLDFLFEEMEQGLRLDFCAPGRQQNEIDRHPAILDPVPFTPRAH